MAHPDHDQVIGRLVGARLRGAGDLRPGHADAAEPCPDAEAWAAYVDGGLTADEVIQFDTHLVGCPACRRLVAMLTPDTSAAPAVTPGEAEAPTPGSAAVIPFPRRQVWTWMGLAAGLLAAVTLWSVSRLGSEPPVLRTADSGPRIAAPAPAVAGQPESSPAADKPAAPAAALDRLVATPAPEPPALRPVTPPERAQVKGDAARDQAALRQRLADTSAFASAATAAAPSAGAPAGGAGGFQEAAKPPAEAKRNADAAPAAPAANARAVTLQTNAVVAGVTRAHGPLANQQNVNQQNVNQPIAPALTVPAPPPKPAQAAAAPAAAPPSPPPAPVPVAAPAVAEAGTADARERRANEAEVAEAITTTGAVGGRADAASRQRGAARAEPARAQPVGAEGDDKAGAKEELAKTLGYAAAVAGPVFAEPGGRLRWRIADGRRLESSSDAGLTWKARYTARGDRLRAGTAPAIDSAWAVGERGLVLRLAVPGDWSAVKRPAAVGLIAVSATGADTARVTAEDGRVFATTDGGATWKLVTPGAGPQ